MRSAEEPKADPDQVLASGYVFSVRVHFGKSTATSCQVRVENDRNDWYDEVEHFTSTTLGSGTPNYYDFNFTAKNFNVQITNPHDAPLYTPEAVEGEYTITVTTDDGFSESTRIVWDGKKFSPNLLSFSLE